MTVRLPIFAVPGSFRGGRRWPAIPRHPQTVTFLKDILRLCRLGATSDD